MRDEESWRPTKYAIRGGRLRGSADRTNLAVGSRLAADLVADWYERMLPRYARGRILDLGCGRVPLFGTYRPHVTSVVTVDWPGSQHSGRHVDVLHDLNDTLPFDNSSFESVLLADVLEHIRLPQVLVNEIGRVLKPGGHLIGNVPFLYPIHEAPHDYFRYTRYGLVDLAESAGLEVVILDACGGSLELATDLVAKHLTATDSAMCRVLAAYLQRVVYSFGRTTMGQRLAMRTATMYPFGYFFVAAKGGNDI